MEDDLNKQKLVDKVSKLDVTDIPKRMSIGGPVNMNINNDGKVNPNDTVKDKK